MDRRPGVERAVPAGARPERSGARRVALRPSAGTVCYRGVGVDPRRRARHPRHTTTAPASAFPAAPHTEAARSRIPDMASLARLAGGAVAPRRGGPLVVASRACVDRRDLHVDTAGPPDGRGGRLEAVDADSRGGSPRPRTPTTVVVRSDEARSALDPM
ncbi:MAG: hypothetical protein ACREQ5_34935 [Candidatus Dormibacteria bacterium]